MDIPEYLFKEVVEGDAYVDPAALAVIKDPRHLVLIEASVELTPFARSSSRHGRTMEDPSELIFNNIPVADEFGDTYTTYSIKGADCSLPALRYNPIEYSYVRVNGMLDSATFPRCQAVSKHLREVGVLTEWPMLHARPKVFPDGERDLPLHPFKAQLYGNYLLELESQRSSGQKAYLDTSIGKTGLIGQGLAETKFSVMYRAMLSNVRLWELAEHQKAGLLSQYISKAIESLQLRKPDHFNCWRDIQKLDPTSEEDQETYLISVLPQIMGENLARFHNAGCYHKYLHDGNWTLAGEIVDLDSVAAEIMGPEEQEVTFEMRYNEVFDVFNSIIRLSARVAGSNDVDSVIDYTNPMLETYKRSYFAERYLDEDISPLERVYLDTHFIPMEEDKRNIGAPMILSCDDRELNRAIVEMLVEIDANKHLGVDANLDLVDQRLQPIIKKQVVEFLNAQGFTKGIYPKWLDVDRIVAVEQQKLLVSLTRVNQ